MSDILKLYNPANAAALTPEQTEGLQKLTTEEIGQLAKAYPNATMKGAYLLIVDSSKPVQKQLPSLSTFQNLFNLRTKNNMKQFVAYAFKGNYQPRRTQPTRTRRSEVLDLSDTELLNLPGFKTGVGTSKEETIPAETVQVTKVKEKVEKPQTETAKTPKKGRPKKVN